MLGGEVVALDLGSERCGYVAAYPGTKVPQSMTLLLRRDREPVAVAYSNLLEFLVEQFSGGVPHLVAKEESMHLGGFGERGMSEANVKATFGLHAIVEAVCVRFGVPFIDCHQATVAKHFVGKGNLPRAQKKFLTRQRCVQLGYVKAGEDFEDRCDALAVFDFACATHAKIAPRELVLFPPQVEKQKPKQARR